MSYYEDLQLSSEATDEEIEKAYKRLAKQHHPDKGGSEANFQRIKLAYDILSNPSSRARYDRGEEVLEAGSSRADAINNLQSVMVQVLNEWGFMPEHSDLVRRMKEEINEVELKLQKDIENAQHDIGKMHIVMSRLKNAEILMPFLVQQRKHMQSRVGELEYQLEINRLMIELLDGVTYDTSPDEDDSYLQKAIDL